MDNPLTVIASLGSGKSRLSNEGVVKRGRAPLGASISPPNSMAMTTQANQVNLSYS